MRLTEFMVLESLVSEGGPCSGGGMPRVHMDEFSYASLNIWVGSDEVGDDGSYFCSVLPYILRTLWDWHRDCPRKVKSTQDRNINRWTTDPLHILSPVSFPPPPLLSRYYSSMYKGELLPFINECGSSDHLIVNSGFGH